MTSPTTQPVPNPTGTAAERAAAFVEAVRVELDDLTPDEVNELTGGLEADLADAPAEPPPEATGEASP
jgi:hypothetical protein